MPKNDGALRRGVTETPRDDTPTLDEIGIDKNLAKQARKLARMEDSEFEAYAHGYARAAFP